MSDLSLDVSDADLEAYREAANPYRHVRNIAAYEHAVIIDALFPHLAQKHVDKLPWNKADGKIGFRPGEVTLWHGINGHGKSAVTTQVALWFALQDKHSCIASFEMLPTYTVGRMVRQCAGNGQPTEKFMREFFAAMKGKIWIYDKRDTVDTGKLYAVIRYCNAELGVKHFFIDSLMKCVRGEDDYNAQKDFVGALCEIAHETGMHIHLIHHVRKGNAGEAPPSKFDAKGSGAITDQVDNVIAVWRNKDREAKLARGETDDSPDFLLICDKQRNGGWEGRIGLWGDLSCWHFRETQEQPWGKGYSLDRSDLAA